MTKASVKSLLGAGGAALLATLLLAGCGGGGASTTPDGRAIKAKPPATEKIAPPEEAINKGLEGEKKATK